MSDFKAQAQDFKNQGNAALKEGKIEEAIQHYTQAISIDPDNHVFYSNRSAAYLTKGDAKSKALKDAQKCVSIKPDWPKGYNRLGAAERALTRYAGAIETYKKGLKIDPQNEAFKTFITECEELEVKQKAEIERQKKLKAEAEEKQKQEIMARAMQKAAAEAVFEEGEDVSSDEEDDAPAPAPAPPPAENPDDLLAGFFGDLAEAEDELKGDHKSEDKKKKLALYEPKTPQLQIDRLMAKHHQWRNLDPFMVLELSDDLDCDVDDIKNRYRKLSQMLHPDKCSLPNGRDSFEYVKDAYTSLMDENGREITKKLIARADKTVLKRRRKLVKKGMKEEELPDGPVERDAVMKGRMKMFAQVEQRRRKMEKLKSVYTKREADKHDLDQDKLKGEYKFNKDWTKEDRAEKRVGNWRDFEREGKKAKIAKAGWKEETRDTTDYKAQDGKAVDSTSHITSYRKKWK